TCGGAASETITMRKGSPKRPTSRGRGLPRRRSRSLATRRFLRGVAGCVSDVWGMSGSRWYRLGQIVFVGRFRLAVCEIGVPGEGLPGDEGERAGFVFGERGAAFHPVAVIA